jgi:hypothetical protein
MGIQHLPNRCSKLHDQKIAKDGATYGLYVVRDLYFRNYTSFVSWKIMETFGASTVGLGTDRRGISQESFTEQRDLAVYKASDQYPQREVISP